MIAAIYAVTMLAALLVVLTPVSAWAECAWVLWVVPGTFAPAAPGTTVSVQYVHAQWAPVRTFNALPPCNLAQEEATRAEDQQLSARNKDKSEWQTYLYRCLPDTVDPRGPKGSGR